MNSKANMHASREPFRNIKPRFVIPYIFCFTYLGSNGIGIDNAHPKISFLMNGVVPKLTPHTFAVEGGTMGSENRERIGFFNGDFIATGC